MKQPIVSVLLALASAPALAQETIIVTADRTGEARDSAVLAAGIVDAEAIIETGAQHPAELINRVPGAYLHRGNGAEHLTAIRSPVLTGGAGAGSFLYLEDGVPLRAAGFSNVNGLFEAVPALADGIEVLRGPGSALQGSNGLHGVINLRLPEAGSNYLEAEAGSFGRYRGRGMSAWQGGYVALGLQHEDGWRDAAGLDRQSGVVRLNGTASDVDWRLTLSAVNLNQETAGFIFGTDAYKDEAASRVNGDPEAFRDAYAVRASLRLDGRAGAWDWTLTPYLRSNAMDFLMHFLPSEALEESGHDSVGFQASFNRNWDGIALVLGADIDRTRGYLRETQERPTIFSFVQGDHYDYDVDADVAAVYGQTRWSLSDRLDLQAGLRVEHTRYDYRNALDDNVVGRFLRLADREDDFTTVTPHLGFNWSVDAAASVFGRIARGARAPQTAELYRLQPNQIIDEIDPETIDSIELGYRRGFASGGRLEVVAFSMTKENVFFRDADGFNVTDGKTTHDGVELELSYPLSPGLRLDLGAVWAEHRYAFDRNVGNQSEVVRDGAAIDTAPEWLWNARLNWEVTASTRLAAEWVHVGEYQTNAANTRAYDGHDVVNLRARHDFNEGLTGFIAVRNAFDTRYAERADFAFGNDRYFPGEPRAVSIGLRWEY
ncbi:TonB-dependent receptor [Maricaulis sp.]|uniref:TonB-dependent receptor n=1 Tax=Maricaulis sp. TaxID=1486257 RepID=UPI002605DE03|nr:TonB-dependent receptor [Maricaulis sp.]